MKLTSGQDELGAALASLRRPAAAAPSGGGVRWGKALAIMAGAATVAGAVAWFSATRSSAVPAAAPAPVATVASARAGSVSCTGFVEEEDHARVAATVMAAVARVHVREGDVVAAGAPLVDLDTTELEATLFAARARVAAASARVEVASLSRDESTLSADRERNLVALGASPKATVEDADAKLRVLGASTRAARADASAAQAEVAVLEARLALHHLVAPFAGVVVTRPAAVGDVALPGAPLLELAGALVVTADVPESRLAMLAVGAPAEVRLDAFPDALAGAVVGFAPRVDKAKATGAVKVRITRADVPLRVGMAARVQIDAKEKNR